MTTTGQPIDIAPAYLAIVRDILDEHVPDCEVRAFGSRATWVAKDYSDLDLAIVSDQPIKWRVLSELKNAFEESYLPFRVDVLDWHDISDNFREIIRGDCTVIKTGNQLSEPILNEWPTKHFGDCATLIRESISPSLVGDVPYIGLEHIGEGTLSLADHGVASDVTSTKSSFKQGDILFGKLRPYFRKVIQAPFDGICSTDIWVVRAKDGIDQEFLFYCMASEAFVNFATNGSEGTRMPRAKWEYISRYKLPVPTLREQQKIAHILGSLDEKIELNRRMNETLEEMAQALFKSWFVDFDPVRAKMEGRWRSGESLPGLPAHLYDLFPDRLISSDLGDIPEGWTIKALIDCFSLTMGQSPPGNTYNNNRTGLPFFQGSTNFGARYPNATKYCSEPKRTAQLGDTLVSVRAPVGDINMAWEKCCIGRGLASLKHGANASSFTYYSTLSLKLGLQQFEHTGTVFGAITKQQLEGIRCIDPTLKTILEFESRAADFDSQIYNNTAKSVVLTSCRDTMLSDLYNSNISL